MKNSTADALVCAVTETIESMAFAEVVHSETFDFIPLPGEGDLTAALPAYSPEAGEICIIMPRLLLDSLIDSIHAPAEEAAGEDMAGDTLLEILNTMAGIFLNRITDPGTGFVMGLPVLGGDFIPAAGGEKCACLFDVEGHRLVLSFSGAIKT